MVCICTRFFTLSKYVLVNSLENSEPLQCSYLYYKSNYCSMDCHQFRAFNKPEELLVQIKSEAFSTISASLEFSSSILDSVSTLVWQDKSTDNFTRIAFYEI